MNGIENNTVYEVAQRIISRQRATCCLLADMLEAKFCTLLENDYEAHAYWAPWSESEQLAVLITELTSRSVVIEDSLYYSSNFSSTHYEDDFQEVREFYYVPFSESAYGFKSIEVLIPFVYELERRGFVVLFTDENKLLVALPLDKIAEL